MVNWGGVPLEKEFRSLRIKSQMHPQRADLTLELFNTLSGKIEPLTPADGETLRMYACGPTVYDFGHIGNFRTFIHVDLLRRTLKMFGINVRHVMNITDVDDKIIRGAQAANQPLAAFTHKFETAFLEDMDFLGVERPEVLPRATEHIPEMVSLIQELQKKDIAYQTEDGSWYFRIDRFPDYGKLSKKDFEGIEDGSRVDIGSFDKDAARDFALWKAVKTSADGTREPSWETALGPGRPGWHIECSAMATRFLGADFDLHAGGEDLMFPHHENEIAQSESACAQPFARHWMHVRFLLVEGKKMSKSEGNFYTLRDLLLKGFRASAIRFLLMSVPYRHQLNFTWDGLTESTNAVDRLRTFADRMKASFPEGHNHDLAVLTAKAAADYTAALANDLNTAEARAAIFDLVRAANTAADSARLFAGNAREILDVLTRFDAVFAVLEDRDAQITRAALEWAEQEGRLNEADPSLIATLALTDEAIDALVAERTQAKKTRNFARADAIRNDLLAQGILIEDSKDGVRWKRK
jgi:cysteinyl-tRNA synthetase